MKVYSPEVQKFVESYVFDLLDSVRRSKQVEDNYSVLTRATKGASTKQMRERAKKAAQYILENVKDIEELGDLDDDTLVREALNRALPEDD